MSDWTDLLAAMNPDALFSMNESSGTTCAETSQLYNMDLYNTPNQGAASIIPGAAYTYSVDFRRTQSEYARLDAAAVHYTYNGPLTLAIWFETQLTGHLDWQNQVMSVHSTTSNRFMSSITSTGEIDIRVYDSDDLLNATTTTEDGYNDGSGHLLAVQWPGASDTGRIVVDGQILTGTVHERYRNGDRFSLAQEWDASPSDFFDGRLQALQMYRRYVDAEDLYRQFKIGSDAAVTGAPYISGDADEVGATLKAYDTTDGMLCATATSAADKSYKLQSWLMRDDREFIVLHDNTDYRPHGPITPIAP